MRLKAAIAKEMKLVVVLEWNKPILNGHCRPIKRKRFNRDHSKGLFNEVIVQNKVEPRN